MPQRRRNAIVEADQFDDADVFEDVESEDEEAEDRDEEVEETEILDADDMYGIASDEAGARQAAHRRLGQKGKGQKTGKAKGTKAAAKSHKDDEWRPANSLDAPAPRPGMIQRWIRHLEPGAGSHADAKNWTRAVREGWKPRDVSTVPEGWDAPTGKHSSGATLIIVGDLVLCEMTRARFQSRRKYFLAKHARQMSAIQRKPLSGLQGPDVHVTNKRDVSFGRRRRATATEE